MMISNRQPAWALLATLAGVLVGTAHADKPARADVGALDTAYQPTAQAASTARFGQACADASKLDDAAAHLADKPPAGSVFTAAAWADEVQNLRGVIRLLHEVCKPPGHKDPLTPSTDTPDSVLKDLDAAERSVVGAAKPRTLAPALKTAKSAIDTYTDAKACSTQQKFARAITPVATPPAGADAGAWTTQYQQVTAKSDALKAVACGSNHDAEDEIGNAFQELRGAFYALVLLVPAS